MKVFITGSSGVGKTTVTDELSRRGYNALDTHNVPGMARLEIRETGRPTKWPKAGLIDWKKYSWSLQPAVLDKVLSLHETLFLSGVCGNQNEFYHKFDKRIVLTINPEEYLRRMRSRTRRGINDDEVNILSRLQKYSEKEQQFLNNGFIPVDKSGLVELTVNKILDIVNEK